MKRFNFVEGMRVHIDVDDPQWGRVASDGTIIEVKPRWLLVNVDSIRAGIIVKRKDAYPLLQLKALRKLMKTSRRTK